MLTRPRPAAWHCGLPAAPTEWSRARLVAALLLLLVIGLSLVGGMALGLWLHFRGPDATASGGASKAGTTASVKGPGGSDGGSGAVQARRDALASAPMKAAPAGAAQPSPLSSRDPGAITVATSASSGAVGVPSEFPHTPEGAVAQLAAIDADVLTNASVDHARQVISGWAAAGGPTPQTWSGVQLITDFLSGLQLPPAGAGSGLAVQATPMMGLVKATDGPDWTVVCVDTVMQVTLKGSGQLAVADCQRMVWASSDGADGADGTDGTSGGRWVIGPGLEPAPAPSIWPGTDAAIDAGWKDLRRG